MTKPLYFYNGTTFELVGPTTPQSPIAYQTSAPTAPATGDLWIDSDGDVDTYNRQLTRYYFVATAGQTSISGVDANGLTLAYVAGSEAVYVNGALQVRGQDYTATNGTSITGLSALALNDVVEVFAYTAFTVGDIIPKSTIQAKGDLLAGTANTTVGRLAVGTNGQMLVADSSASTGLAWANAGKILQVVEGSTSTPVTNNTSTPADTGLSASITPSSTSNKILVMFSMTYLKNSGTAGTTFQSKIVRGTTDLVTYSGLGYTAVSNQLIGQISNFYLDSPSSTSSLTYKLQFWNSQNAAGVTAQQDSNRSSIILMEIKA